MRKTLSILMLAGLLAIGQPAWTIATSHASSPQETTHEIATALVLPVGEPLSDQELSEIHGDFAVLAGALYLAGQALLEVGKTAVVGAVAGVVANGVANALNDDGFTEGIGCAALGGASGAVAARWNWTAPVVIGVYEGVCR